MNIVVLTGAGISAESGIQTFRASDGLWENHRVEDVATPEGFLRNPELVQQFYNARRAQLKTVKPNAAHTALAKLQQAKQHSVVLVTQNVDDLHERAGAEVIHMHGELKKIRCLSCGEVSFWEEDVDGYVPCPNCGQKACLRPDIVWFGEMPYYMEEIETALLNADVFVAIGTSSIVYPAAGFVQTAKCYGAKTVEINLGKTAASRLFDEGVYGQATEAVSYWVEDVLFQ
ncbi:Sir2 family NAD+-dependent deacetylase [Suttonella ornithocola]|uniref:NAD-dependent protein deacylase n=1 Tax=Suttonella ornithocola TaxID=279832 RepID=A0A380MYA2_9GAMM|nr:Sir2 family NAD+-dependent deacetylase [Suttonella ornithocola]SUO97006.1 NAD-dependent deacetylase [Suttonella ornithocola]